MYHLKPKGGIENAFKTKRGTVKLFYLYGESCEKRRNLTLKKTNLVNKSLKNILNLHKYEFHPEQAATALPQTTT